MIRRRFPFALTLTVATAPICGLFHLATLEDGTRDKSKRETIQATAVGQQRASGKP